MKLLISWSGTRSRYIAEALRRWIPKVIQAVKPWMSQEDIASGARWAPEIANELETSQFGIVCTTPENQTSPWIMFEAGALSKTLSNTYVCPYLYDLKIEQLSGPMTQFQASVANKDGTLKILNSINKVLGEAGMSSEELNEIFDVWWPKLEETLSAVPSPESPVTKEKSEKEFLAEILNNTREQLRREEARLWYSQERDKKLEIFIDSFATMITYLQDNILNTQKKIQADIPAMLKTLAEKTGINTEELGLNVEDIIPRTTIPDMKKIIAEVKDLSAKQNKLTDIILEKKEEKNC